MALVVETLQQGREGSEGDSPFRTRTFVVEASSAQALNPAVVPTGEPPKGLPAPGSPFPGISSLILTRRFVTPLTGTHSRVVFTYTSATRNWQQRDTGQIGYLEESMDNATVGEDIPVVTFREEISLPDGSTTGETETTWKRVGKPRTVYEVRVNVNGFTSTMAATIAAQVGKIHDFGGTKWLFTGGPAEVVAEQPAPIGRVWSIVYSWETRPDIAEQAEEFVNEDQIVKFRYRPPLPLGFEYSTVTDGATPETTKTVIIAYRVNEEGDVLALPGVASPP